MLVKSLQLSAMVNFKPSCLPLRALRLTVTLGVRYKATAIADMFWRPFDVRYATILDRLQSHQELFRQEMQLEESLYMEQNQLKGLKELRKLRETIIQLEKFITFKFEGLEDKQPLASPVSNTPGRHHLDQQHIKGMILISLESLLLKIKTWINSPDYMRQYEKAQSLRLNGTGSWFTDSECYKTFKSFENICTDDDSEGILSLDARRILLVRGELINFYASVLCLANEPKANLGMARLSSPRS